jgi:DNA polymerase III subunit alpha
MSDAPIKKRLSVLHAHSVYSLLDGASDIAAYLKWCKETGAPALALTDHGWQIGNLELYEKARKAGVTPIPGCEFYIAYDKTHQFVKRPRDYAHVTAWAINEQGYRNLMKLGSISWNKDTIPGFAKNKGDTNYRAVEKDRVVVKWGTQQKPRITLDELLTYNEGLVLGSGCLIGLLSSVFLN